MYHLLVPATVVAVCLINGLPLDSAFHRAVSAPPQRSVLRGWWESCGVGTRRGPVLLQELLASPACCLDTRASQLPHVFEGLKNGLQGHVTSRFRGQGSVSPASPSHPDAEDKAHIEAEGAWKEHVQIPGRQASVDFRYMKKMEFKGRRK